MYSWGLWQNTHVPKSERNLISIHISIMYHKKLRTLTIKTPSLGSQILNLLNLLTYYYFAHVIMLYLCWIAYVIILLDADICFTDYVSNYIFKWLDNYNMCYIIVTRISYSFRISKKIGYIQFKIDDAQAFFC